MVSYLLGNYLVEEGFMTKEQLLHVISKQEEIRVKLGLIAVSEGMLTLDQADAINRMQQTMDKRFGDIAVEKGYLTEAQVSSLLKMQGNEYLTFAQTLVDEDIVSMDKIQLVMRSYQVENGFTNTEMEAIKSGDVDKIVPLFIPQGTEEYQEIVAIALKTIIRCIDRHAYPMSGAVDRVVDLEKPVYQELVGKETWRVCFADGDKGLCALASVFAKEEFLTVDEDVQDAVGELLNCINGLFATAQSNKGVALELMPPVLAESGPMKGDAILVVPFGVCGATVNFVVVKK